MGSSLTKIVIGRDRTAPETPANLTATAVSSSQINLACALAIDPAAEGAATSGVAEYRWWVSASGTNYSLLTTTAVPFFAYTGLPVATRYYFAVSAVDRTGNESELSGVVSAVTWEEAPTNRAPTWSTSQITLFVYPGDVVSRQLTEASDPDGDSLTYTELATGVLALVGLAVSADGRVTGTIPADADPQTVNATVQASDGQLSASVSLRVQVLELSDQPADPDYAVRAAMPGVFFATNWTERRIGAQGYEWADRSRTGQTVDPTYYLTNNITPSDRSYNLGPAYDNKGVNWRETSAEIAGPVGGACYGLRRIYRISSRSVDGAVIAPFSAMPRLYAGGTDSAPGRPGYRRGEKGTQGEGNEFKYVETEAGGLDDKGNNPDNLPCGRHFYLQFQIRLSSGLLWNRDRWIRAKHNLAQSPTITDKLVFITGGQSSDQIAVVNGGGFGRLRVYLGNGSGVRSWAKARPHRGDDEEFMHSYIDDATTGEPAAASTTPFESMLRRYGPANGSLIGSPLQAAYAVTLESPDLAVPRRDTYVLPMESAAAGIDTYEANNLSAVWRNYPFGGFDATLKTIFPELDIPASSWTGVLEPDKWHVVEVLLSDQRDTFVDDGTPVFAVKSPCYPRFVACWAAPLGDPPRLLGYTNIGDEGGSAMIGARINDSNPVLFKWQQSDFDNIAYSGWMVIGPSYHPSAMVPTDTQFDVILYNPVSTSLATTGRYTSNNNRTSEWASVDGWGDNSTLGFTRGVLAGADYRPPLPHPERFQGLSAASSHAVYHQYEILTTRLIGATVADPAGVVRQIHRVTLRSAAGVAPTPATGPADIQDGFVAGHFNDRSWADKRGYYGPVIFSCDPIPFPGHLGTPLPTPWRD